MAIKVIAAGKKGQPGTDVLVDVLNPQNPEQDARHADRIDPLGQPTQWSSPPVSNYSAPFDDDESLSLEMGVVYKLQMLNNYLIQNISENEDDKIEFSMHGDANGTWGRLNSGGMLRATGDLFLLNRTHMENLRVAMIMEP